MVELFNKQEKTRFLSTQSDSGRNCMFKTNSFKGFGFLGGRGYIYNGNGNGNEAMKIPNYKQGVHKFRGNYWEAKWIVINHLTNTK